VPLVIDWVDWWGRGGLIQEQRPRWYQWLFGALETYYEEHFRTQAQATTVISHGLGQRAVRLGVDPQTIYWIPSASDVHRIQPVAPGAHRTAFGLGPDRFILGFSALDVTLGLDLVLAALRAVLPRCPEVLLVMTGKQSRAIDDAIARHDLAAQVRHFGLLPYADYERLVACTDVFLLPFVDTVANRGRWPGRIRDAMAAARPVVSNPVGEMQILLTQEEIGLLAEETPQDMAAQILRLRQDPELRRRLGENARRLAETRFSMKQVTDDLERCYRETLERAKPARSPGSRMQAHPPRSTTTATG
jgi:glycosyltransferase involved in cell wall biosynthesis